MCIRDSHIPHGSILVHISVKDGFYRISADCLNLPEKGRVAMLRQIADLNLNKLLLPRFVKDNDKLRKMCIRDSPYFDRRFTDGIGGSGNGGL